MVTIPAQDIPGKQKRLTFVLFISDDFSYMSFDMSAKPPVSRIGIVKRYSVVCHASPVTHV
jgi:hypothetical protein